MENKSKFVNIRLSRKIAEDLLDTYNAFLDFSHYGKKEIKTLINSLKKALEQ